MQDRYGNHRSTTSDAAFEQYCLGVDLSLAAQPGGIEALTQATELDPNFAVAHADLARGLQILSKPKQARVAMARARALEHQLGDSERGHVNIMGHLIDGQADRALALVKAHLQSFPRDAMVVAPACGVFGLIGFSGRVGREAENLAFMESVAAHYIGDWWFESQMAFSLCEVGQLAKAGDLIETAYAANPHNANAVHHRAHIHYELGESHAGRVAITAWRASYARQGLLHCHLAWHDALWALEAGHVERVWDIVAADIHPQRATAPPINIVTDLVALLLRTELLGHERPNELWRLAADYAQEMFAKPGLSFVDYHCAIAYAVTEREEHLTPLTAVDRGVASDQVAAIATAFAEFAEKNWQGMLAKLTPIMATHERLGGSRAQRDLLELSYAYALVGLGYNAEAERFINQRRPRCLAGRVLA